MAVVSVAEGPLGGQSGLPGPEPPGMPMVPVHPGLVGSGPSPRGKKASGRQTRTISEPRSISRQYQRRGCYSGRHKTHEAKLPSSPTGGSLQGTFWGCSHL